eukprot:TRINITY_DN2082_c0_g1_i4.p1 TRINITY_DN2082_c0_g1~~TRINITY_DN2082_c0_g1_i4.p1  ORF type:complete len:103 (+),score=14.23 TRINITY_DN2082_c0_g1_i4:151-459(+)
MNACRPFPALVQLGLRNLCGTGQEEWIRMNGKKKKRRKTDWQEEVVGQCYLTEERAANNMSVLLRSDTLFLSRRLESQGFVTFVWFVYKGTCWHRKNMTVLM